MYSNHTSLFKWEINNLNISKQHNLIKLCIARTTIERSGSQDFVITFCVHTAAYEKISKPGIIKSIKFAN